MNGLGRKPKLLSLNDNPLSDASDIKAKGPAATGIAPDHGSTSHRDAKMNEVTNTTSEHPWEAARRHAKNLSAALTDCNGGSWYAHVFPSDRAYSVCFAAKPVAEKEAEMPIDRVNRLASELSQALDEYADGRFSARVYPSERAGTSVMFMSIASERRAAE